MRQKHNCTLYMTMHSRDALRSGSQVPRGRVSVSETPTSLLLDVTLFFVFHPAEDGDKGKTTGSPGLGQTPKWWENGAGRSIISKTENMSHKQVMKV